MQLTTNTRQQQWSIVPLHDSTLRLFADCLLASWPWGALHDAVLHCLRCYAKCETEELVCHYFHHFYATSVRTVQNKAGATRNHKAFQLRLCSADTVLHLAIHSCFWWFMLSELYKRHPKQLLCCRQPQCFLWSMLSLSSEHRFCAAGNHKTFCGRCCHYPLNIAFVLQAITKLSVVNVVTILWTPLLCCRQSQSPSTTPSWMKSTHCWLTAAETLSWLAQPPPKTWTGSALQRR